MPYRPVKEALVVILIPSRLSRLAKRQRDAIDNSGATNQTNENIKKRTKHPPSHRYRDYTYPNDGEHHTFEQKIAVGSLGLVLVTTIAACIAAGFAIAGWQQSRRQANAAENTLAEMRDEQRPWLKVTVSIAEGIKSWFNDGIGGLHFKISAENVGHEPATEVSATIVAYPVGNKHYDVRGAQKRACFQKAADPSGRVIFPGQQPVDLDNQVIGNVAWIVSRLAADQIIKQADNKPAIELYLYGCVTYKFSSSRVFHQTGYFYQLAYGHLDKSGIFGYTFSVPLNESVPMDNLRLFEMPTLPQIVD